MESAITTYLASLPASSIIKPAEFGKIVADAKVVEEGGLYLQILAEQGVVDFDEKTKGYTTKKAAPKEPTKPTEPSKPSV